MIAIQESLWRADAIAKIKLDREDCLICVQPLHTENEHFYGYASEDEAASAFMEICEKWKRELEGART
jgi:hypothetical protein